MTIAIALKTTEGVVVGADSTATFGDPSGALAKAYNSAQKVIEIGPRRDGFLPAEQFAGCVAICGAGSFGPASWRNFINGFYCDRIRNSATQADLPEKLLEYATQKWAEFKSGGAVAASSQIPDAALHVVSIGVGETEVVGGQVELVSGVINPLGLGGLIIGGGGEVVARLLDGYDHSLKAALLANGVDSAVFDACAANLSAVPPLDALPLRDAVDFVHFLAYSAVKLHRYRGAPALIGGAIEVAAITADRGFRWIVHKPLYDSIGIQKGVQMP